MGSKDDGFGWKVVDHPEIILYRLHRFQAS
jgi:hypothetical protein